MRIRLKITLVMLCLLAVLFGVGGSALISIAFNAAYAQEKEAALDSYQTALNAVSLVSQIEGRPDARGMAEILQRLKDQRVLITPALRLSSQGRTLYEDEGEEGAKSSATLNRSAALMRINDIPRTGTCLTVNFERAGRHYLQVRGTLGDVGGDISGTADGTGIDSDTAAGSTTNADTATTGADDTTPLVLDIAYDITPVYTARTQQQTIFYRVLAVVIVVCAVLTYSVVWFLTRPLMRLSRAARQLTRGNLSYRATVKTNDEIGALADDFNIMAGQVERGVTALKSNLAHQEQFMASFTHELKTPMTSIIGFAELLRNQDLSEEERLDAAHYIFSEGKRLESLSFKLLEILSEDTATVQMTRLSPGALINEVVESLRSSYDKEGISLLYKAHSGTCLLEGDLVKSLVMNLLDNARKALDDGGIITLESKVVRDACLIRISDNGKGIPKEALAHLTEAFYRVDTSRAREQGGAGLGLALCDKIVQLHHGWMRFESTEGVGTCVTVFLRGANA